MYHIRLSIVNNVPTWRVWEQRQGIIVAQFKTELEAIEWVEEILKKDSGAVKV